MTSQPKLKELRYSADHDGWFWTVTAPDPTPLCGPDGKVIIHDQQLWDSGYARRKQSAERAVKRAIRRMKKKIDRAQREQR